MNYKFKTKPYAHQLKALEMSWDRPYLHILWRWVLVNSSINRQYIYAL